MRVYDYLCLCPLLASYVILDCIKPDNTYSIAYTISFNLMVYEDAC